MRILSTKDSRTLWFGHADRPCSFASPTGDAEFALLLIAADPTITPDEQHALSEQLVRTGCRHAVCFGADSSSWDDSIDWVSVMDTVGGTPGPFVMTSWFDDAPLGEAVDFFADCTAFDDWTPDTLVVLVLGGSPDLDRDVQQALLARFG